MDEELKKIVQRMVEAGESEDNIGLVIQNWKKKSPDISGQDSASGAQTSTEPLRTFQAPDVPEIGVNTLGSNLTQPSSFGDIAASAAANVDETRAIQDSVQANMPYLQEDVTRGAVPTPLTPESQQQYVQDELIPYVERQAEQVQQFNESLDNIRQQNRAAGYFTDHDKEVLRNQRIEQIQNEMADSSKNAGFLSRNIMQPANNFAQGFTQSVANLGSSVLGIPRFANDIVASAMNGMISLTGSDASIPGWDDTYGNTPLDQVQNYVREATERQRQLLDKKYGEGGTWEQFKSGNINGAINLIAHGVGETAPIMALFAMTGGAGAAAQTAGGTAVFGSMTYDDLRDSDVPDELKLANSLVGGFAEGFFEQVGTGWLFRGARNILEKQGKKAASEFLENTLEKTMRRAYEKYYVLSGPAGEIMTEGATMMTQNFMDRITGVDPDRGLLDGWQDTAILAAAASAPISTPTAAIRSIRDKKARTHAESLSEYNQGIIEAMQSEDLTVEEKAAMFERYQNNTQKINEYLEIERADRGRLTNRQQALLEGIESRQSEIDALMANESIPDAVKSGLEQEAADLQVQVDILTKEATKELPPERVDDNVLRFRENNPSMEVPSLTEGLPESAATTLERLDNNQPVDPIAAKEASDALYTKYKEFQAMKSDPNRVHTIEEIDAVMEPLGQDIERLENYTTESNTQRVEEVATPSVEPVQATETVTAVETPTETEEAATAPETAPQVVEESAATEGQYFTRDIGGEQTVYRRNEDGTASIVPDTEAQTILDSQTETAPVSEEPMADAQPPVQEENVAPVEAASLVSQPRSEFANEGEYYQYVAETSTNPDEVASAYHYLPDQEGSYIDEGIMDYLGSGKINRSDYERYGDRNNLDRAKSRRWVDSKNSSLPLDVMAQELSDNLGVEVTPADIIDFVDTYRGSEDFAQQRKSDAQKALEQKYKELTGRNLTPVIAERAANRVNQNLTDQQRLEASEVFTELGITYEDVLNYENSIEETAREAEGSISESTDVAEGSGTESGANTETQSQSGATEQVDAATQAEHPEAALKQSAQESPAAAKALRDVAAKIRQGKINRPGTFRASTGVDAIWDGALETVAASLEAGATVVEAIDRAISQIKETDWYKSHKDRESVESDFRGAIEEAFATEEQPAAEAKKETKKTPTVKQLADNDSERRTRSSELSNRIGRYKEKGPNYWRDVSMYAANRIIDGEMNSARDLARELHLMESPEVSKAFSEAKRRLDEGVEGYTTSAKNAETARKREQYGFDERIMPEREIREGVISDAREALQDGYDVGGLMARIEGGSGADSFETAVLIQYAAANEAEMIRQGEEIERTKQSHFTTVNEHIEARERAANNLIRVYNAMEKSGTVNARALGIRQTLVNRDFSLASMIAERRRAIGSDVFTKSQLDAVEKKYRELNALNERIKKRNAELEVRNSELDAQLAIERAKNELGKRKAPKKPRTEQVRDIEARRKEVLSEIKDAWEDFKVSGFAYDPRQQDEKNRRLGKALLDLLDTYIDEGIVGAEVIIDRMHEQLKSVIPGVDRKQVMDAIAGAYDDPRPPLTELQKERRNFRNEFNLLQQIEDAEKGIKRTKDPIRKEVQNARLEELRERLNRLRESDTPMVSREEKRLDAAKKMVQNRIKELDRRIRDKDFAPPVRDVIEADPELEKLRKELRKRIFDFRVENKKYELERLTKTRKFLNAAINIAGVPRTLMATADFSAPLRQGIFVAASRPFVTGRAVKEMFRFWNSKEYYNEWMADFRESPGAELAKKSGLSITDTATNVEMAAREEDFMSNLVEKVPFFGDTFNLKFDVKGRRFQIGDLHGRSERAYTGFLNKMRIDLFQKGTELLLNQGYNPNDDIKPFKALATYVNAATGRGPMPDSLKTSAAALSTLFFAPRLITSRLYLLGLGPLWYAPMAVKKMYLRDLASFVAFGNVILQLAGLAGADVEDDPRSADFGKIRFGDDRYDIWGGFTQYVTLVSRIASGETVSSTGRVRPLDGMGFMAQDRGDVLGRFARSKLAPTTALGWSWFTGKNYMGEAFDWGAELLNMSSPLVLQDIHESIRDDKPWWEVAGGGALMMFGVGFQSYNANSFLKKGVDNKLIDLLNDKKSAAIEPTEGRTQVYNVETGEKETLRGEKMKRYREYWTEYLKSDLETNREEYSKYGPNTFDRKFTGIKQAATAYAKKQISGVATEDLTIRSENKTYRLTPEQVRMRLDMMKEYKERFGHKVYAMANKYERKGMSRDAALIQAHKDFDSDARSESRDAMVKMNKRGELELTEGLED